MHFLPENRMCAPPFATKTAPPHLENPGSATDCSHKFGAELELSCWISQQINRTYCDGIFGHTDAYQLGYSGDEHFSQSRF